MLFPSFFNAGVSTYEIEQSLRFDGSSYMDPPDDVFGNETGTYSFWVKRSELGAENTILWNKRAGDNHWGFRFDGADTFTLFKTASGSDSSTTTTAKFRDPSAWYHILVTTTSSANEVFVNGTSVATGSYEWAWQDANPRIGYRSSTDSFQGYLAEWHYISGSVKSVSDFTETDANGVLRPIKYTGSYGTNGYYLKFDTTDTNGILHDSSGQANHFNSSTGFTTSGTGTDVMSDTPTKNYMTLNPLDTSRDMSSTFYLSNGNLDLNVSNNSSYRNLSATFWPEGLKGYYEVTVSTGTPNFHIGFTDFDRALTKSDYTVSNINYYINESGTVKNGPTNIHSSYLSSFSSGDTLGVAFDFTGGNRNVWFSKNGTFGSTSGGAGDPIAGTNPALTTTQLDVEQRPYFAINTGAGLQTISLNAGQREFAHPPGTTSATDYFNTVTWTGNGSSTSREITGVGFQPDLVWIKGRSVNGSGHRLQDVVRGAGTVLQTTSTNAEFDDSSNLGAFTSDGFTLTTTGSSYNQNNATYVAWCWKAGGTASSNTDGSTTSSVSANQDAGFSVVTYTGTAANATVGHGLGVAPKMVICKSRDSSSHSWYTYHASLGSSKYIYLNLTNAAGTGAAIWNGDPTSTTFTLGTSNGANQSNIDYVAYCFAEKTGVSKFGTYEGTSATNSIDVGFKPALVMIKNADASSQWMMVDTERGSNQILNPNRTINEFTASSSIRVNLTSSGFILSGNGTDTNVSGNTYIYAAFAENFTADDSYKSLDTANLPAPTVKDGSDYFNTVLYTGNGGTNAITGVGFQPDFLWIKNRGAAVNHQLHDAVRGASVGLNSNNTNAEYTDANAVTSFDSTGWSMNNNYNSHNQSSVAYVAWNWLAGNGTSSNTDGSITSTVSANPTAGFSIVSYVANGTSTQGSTVGHGLGVAPKFIIAKDRDASQNWFAYSEAYPGAAGGYNFNLTQAAHTSDAGYWNSTAPTSAVFTIGNYHGYTGEHNMIAYCFAEVEGYSKFGSYTGNDSTDGVFVYTGFKPAWLLIKRTNTTGSWFLMDSSRNTYNVVDNFLYPNTNGAEDSGSYSEAVDFLSNGFKCRTTSGYINGPSDSYIYMAFASNPFGGDGVSPATAR